MATSRSARSRLLDTRAGLGAPKAALVGHGTLTLQVAGRGGVPATAVAAVVLNVTVLSPSQNGYLTGYATGTALAGSRPTCSSTPATTPPT